MSFQRRSRPAQPFSWLACVSEIRQAGIRVNVLSRDHASGVTVYSL